MKALLSIEPGDSSRLVLSDLPAPTLREGTLLVRVEACALNYPDVLIIEDRYQIKPPRPFAPGGEIAGTIEAVGAGVESWRAGERIIAVTGYGGLAEQVVIEAARAYRLPDGCDVKQGAALLLTYATGIHALLDRGHLREGQTLLVLGAAGGVGLAAVELGKLLGARVVAAVSSAEKAAVAREAGADEAIIYPSGALNPDQSKQLAGQFKAALGEAGAHVIFDPVGGDYAESALRAIAWGGRYLVIGFPAGIPKLPLNLPLLKGCDICGVFWGAFNAHDPERSRAHIHRLLAWLKEGRIAPRVSRTWPLARAREALAHMNGRQAVGKIVVTMRE